MSTNIPAVQETSIQHCLLIDLVLNSTTTYYLSNAFTSITYNGHSYTQLGYFLNMTEIQGDIKPTNNQVSVSLSGIPSDLVDDPGFLNLALNSGIKGSKIKIYRAFFKDGAVTEVYQRFYGYVSNFNLNETWDDSAKITTQAVSLQCSSLNGIIEKQYSGRRTNDKDQKLWYPTDTGMDRVKVIAGSSFDFGKKIAT